MHQEISIGTSCERVALAYTVLQQNERVIHHANHLLDQISGGESGAHTAQALMAGLEHVWSMLLGGNRACQASNNSGTIVIHTGYEPLFNPAQRKSWRFYGSPNPPAPDQRKLNETLARWTTAPGVGGLIIRPMHETTLCCN